MSDELPTPTPPTAAVVESTPTVELTSTPATPAIAQPPIKNLILDAAPLLTLTPLRGMASKYIIAPQVLAEIRDKRAREHFDRLSLLEGVEVQIRDVDAVSLAKVTAFAKQTGDYAVLSHTDLCVLALTYAVEVEENGHWRVREELGKPPAGRPPGAGSTPAPAAPAALPEVPSSEPTTTAPPPPATTDAPLPTTSQPPSTSPKNAPPTLPSTSTWGKKAPTTPYLATPAPSNHITVVAPPPTAASSSSSKPEDAPPAVEEQEIIYHDDNDEEPSQEQPFSEAGPSTSSSNPVDDASSSLAALGLNNDEDPFSEDDDDEAGGEWITSTNISTHKARDLGLSLPETAENSKTKSSKKNKKSKPRAILKSACMTSDFAVQNVLLQMGLNLVGGEGRRIRSVRSWVLRCHACFKLCKDPTKKFCPSCGGPTLLRTSITTVAPSTNPSDPNSTTPSAPTTIVHLKKNFQYHLRGTQYSIPAPKPGSSKSQSSGGSGLVLREDQAEWQRGVRMEEGRRVKAEKKLQRGLEEGRGAGTWRDADWMPEMYAVGAAGKGRADATGRDGGFLPQIGTGRRNPNAVRRGGKKK